MTAAMIKTQDVAIVWLRGPDNNVYSAEVSTWARLYRDCNEGGWVFKAYRRH